MINNQMKFKSNNQGISLIETLVYVAILAVILTFVMSGILSLFKVSESVRSSRSLNQTASVALERVVRDLRDAKSINVPESILDTSPGVLVFTTIVGGGTVTVTYEISDGRLIRTTEAGSEPMSPSDVTISSLVFRHVLTTRSEAVKVDMSIADKDGDIEGVRDFDAITVLRNSY